MCHQCHNLSQQVLLVSRADAFVQQEAGAKFDMLDQLRTDQLLAIVFQKHLVEAVVAHLRGAETAIQPYNAGLVEMAWRKVLLQGSPNTARSAKVTPCASLSLAQFLRDVEL